MSRIAAYLLAADPAWLCESIATYYDVVDTIFICYDQNKIGWTGGPIAVDECIDLARSVDPNKKVVLLPGDFARLSFSAMDNETFQRQFAVDHAGNDYDWILQLDSDELLPNAADFVSRLRNEVPAEFRAVDWPMRTFFHRTADGGFLEVCGYFRNQISGFPGPVAVRAGTRFKHARQIEAPKFRYDISIKDADPAAGGRIVNQVISANQAIQHLSWIRSEKEIEQKLESWGHAHDFDWRKYLDKVWRRAPKSWRWTFRFHPVFPKWWPALRKVKLNLPGGNARNTDSKNKQPSALQRLGGQ